MQGQEQERKATIVKAKEGKEHALGSAGSRASKHYAACSRHPRPCVIVPASSPHQTMSVILSLSQDRRRQVLAAKVKQGKGAKECMAAAVYGSLQEETKVPLLLGGSTETGVAEPLSHLHVFVPPTEE